LDPAAGPGALPAGLADPALAFRPVAAIAATWGFSSATYFGRVFRAAHGMPPQEYRRALHAGEIVRPRSMVVR
jgi:AraC-like DNA-binding protein